MQCGVWRPLWSGRGGLGWCSIAKRNLAVRSFQCRSRIDPLWKHPAIGIRPGGIRWGCQTGGAWPPHHRGIEMLSVHCGDEPSTVFPGKSRARPVSKHMLLIPQQRRGIVNAAPVRRSSGGDCRERERDKAAAIVKHDVVGSASPIPRCHRRHAIGGIVLGERPAGTKRQQTGETNHNHPCVPHR